MSAYSFVTHWAVDAPIEAVWAELYRPIDWPQWWRGVLSVDQLESGDATGLGSYYRIVMRSALPYRLGFNVRTTRLVHPTIIEATSDGELSGTGRWTLTPQPVGTAIRYDWNVETTKRWMRALAPVARPIFEWNHDVIMRWGLEGLEDRLAGRPIARSPD
jgi:hypothetical protein